MKFRITESQLRQIVSDSIKRVLESLENETILVRHMEDSAKYTPKRETSWKKYYENHSEFKFPSVETKCACCGVPTKPKDFVGAHIIEVSNPRKKYIYPLCNVCNGTYGKGKEKSPEFSVQKSRCVVFRLSEARIVSPDE